jgi:hypothetical protein
MSEPTIERGTLVFWGDDRKPWWIAEWQPHNGPGCYVLIDAEGSIGTATPDELSLEWNRERREVECETMQMNVATLRFVSRLVAAVMDLRQEVHRTYGMLDMGGWQGYDYAEKIDALLSEADAFGEGEET